MYENFKQKTIENTMRSLRHLENAGVTIDQRDSFRKWIVDMKRKGALATPQSTANRFLDWLLGERFGSEPVGDLRDAR